jgi:glycosyltransferase involved in cell wall biosynthesis
MKILLANNFYYHRGGDCIYTIHLEQLLKRHGHEVAMFAMQYPDNLPSEWSRYFPSEVKFSPGPGMIEAFLRPFGTREVRRKFTALLDDFQPDIVHLNNIHSQLSPVIAEIAHERGIQVVWTLHDYKLLCPRYDCRRNDKEMCERCFIDKRHVLKNKCMKNSSLASIIAYREALKWSKEKMERYTGAFICPSRFIHDKMMQGDFNSAKLHIIHNFIDVDKTKKDSYEKEDYYCYVGRISMEKGVETLLRAASELPHTLKIIGCGNLSDSLRKRYSHKQIVFLGHKSWEEIKEITGHARFVVVPSECYENNPLSVIEAHCLGTPILGANIGGIPELIEEGGNGMLFESKNVNALKEKIEEMFSKTFDCRNIARNAQQCYSAEKYYEEILKIYASNNLSSD